MGMNTEDAHTIASLTLDIREKHIQPGCPGRSPPRANGTPDAYPQTCE
jgi:hypothetical protein